MRDDDIDMELNNSKEDLERTVLVSFKNGNKSVGQIEGEQHNYKIEKKNSLMLKRKILKKEGRLFFSTR